MELLTKMVIVTALAGPGLPALMGQSAATDVGRNFASASSDAGQSGAADKSHWNFRPRLSQHGGAGVIATGKLTERLQTYGTVRVGGDDGINGGAGVGYTLKSGKFGMAGNTIKVNYGAGFYANAGVIGKKAVMDMGLGAQARATLPGKSVHTPGGFTLGDDTPELSIAGGTGARGISAQVRAQADMVSHEKLGTLQGRYVHDFGNADPMRIAQDGFSVGYKVPESVGKLPGKFFKKIRGRD